MSTCTTSCSNWRSFGGKASGSNLDIMKISLPHYRIVLTEMGFLHSHKESVSGTHARRMRRSGEISLGQEHRTAARCRGSPVTSWLGPSALRASPVSGATARTCPQRARGPRAQRRTPLCLGWDGRCTGPCCAHRAVLPSGQRTNEPLLSFDYVSLGLGRAKLSFLLTNVFPGCSWARAGPSLYLVPVLGLPGLCLLQPHPSPG